MNREFDKLTDEEVMGMVKCNDMHAFEALVERYKKKAYHLALKLVGDSADAKDISQEAFIRIYRARKRYDQNKPFFSWFYTIIANLARNHLKKGKVRLEYRKTRYDEKQAVGAELSLSPEFILESDQTKAMVWKAIDRLSFEHREIIVLRHFEDLSYEEIAKALDIPVGSVMSRLYYARKRLKELLGNSGE
jgi:RNA polymerase sigma-70 factor (ECF subfamily)